MVTIYLLRGGKSIVEIKFERTPADGSQPSSKASFNTSLRSEREALEAVVSGLLRYVDAHGPKDDQVLIELGADDN